MFLHVTAHSHYAGEGRYRVTTTYVYRQDEIRRIEATGQTLFIHYTDGLFDAHWLGAGIEMELHEGELQCHI